MKPLKFFFRLWESPGPDTSCLLLQSFLHTARYPLVVVYMFSLAFDFKFNSRLYPVGWSFFSGWKLDSSFKEVLIFHQTCFLLRSCSLFFEFLCVLKYLWNLICHYAKFYCEKFDSDSSYDRSFNNFFQFGFALPRRLHY